MDKFDRGVSEIRSSIRNAEALSDELLGTLATLKLKMISFRSHPDVEPHAGQKAFIRLQRAEQSLVDAANDLFRTHDELVNAAVRMDVEHPDYLEKTGASGLSDDVPISTKDMAGIYS